MDCYSSGEDYNSRFDTSWYLRTFYGADSHLLKEGCEMQRLCELFAKLGKFNQLFVVVDVN